MLVGPFSVEEEAMSGLVSVAMGAAAVVALSPVTGPPVTPLAADVMGAVTPTVAGAILTAVDPRCPHDIWSQGPYMGDPSKGSTFHGPSYAPGYGMPLYTRRVTGTRHCIGVGSGSESVSGPSAVGAGGAGAGGAGAGGAGAGAGGAGAGGAGAGGAGAGGAGAGGAGAAGAGGAGAGG